MESVRDLPSEPTSLEELGRELDPLTHVEAGATARDLIRRAISRSTIRLVAMDPIVRGNGDPEAVHDARVAVRRLRSDLRTLRPLLHRPWTESLRTELEWLSGLLGRVRDAEVLQARLRQRIGASADAGMASGKVLLDDVAIREAEERRRLVVAMDSDRYRDLVERLAEGAERPRTDEAVADDTAVSVGWLMDGPWRALARSVRRLDPDPDDVALHAVRIRAKRVRYAAEAFAPAFGRPARRFGTAARKLQDVLGDHQDAVIAASWLTERGVDAEDRSVAFAAGRLTEHELMDRDRARHRWPKAWKRLERSERFWR